MAKKVNYESRGSDEMRPEYDFDYSKAKPNRFAGRTLDAESAQKTHLRRKAGSAADLISMADDFDEPLDDFREYVK
jgi:Protein of unknown function (DUF2281)